MATYLTTDFADWGTDWTERYNTGADWPAALSGGDVLVPQASSANDWTAHTWNDIDGDSARADVDVLALVNASNLGTAQRFLIVRASGADESATHFHFSLSSGSHSVGYCSGSDARTNVATFSATYNTSTDYWCRFRVTGTGGTTTYKTKMWTGAAGDEPGGAGSDSNWDLNSTTASGPSSAGWVGLSFYGATGGGVLTVKQLGVGTNGDFAPSAAATAASFAFGPRFPRAILNF